jgi:hypothetical protein
MQDVCFSSIDAFLDYLPPDQRAIVDRLRAIVRETMPEGEERLSFNVPYYRRHRDVCFIWPGCVAWAGKSKPGVDLGFTQGASLYDPRGFLDAGNRKQVYIRHYEDVREIDRDLIAEMIAEAVRVDEERAATRSRRRV